MAAALRIEPRLVAAGLGLTPKQVRVAALLAEGLGVEGIAAALGTTRHTVRKYLKRTYARLGLTGQTQLVRAVLLLYAPAWARGDPMEPFEQLRAVQQSIGGLREATDVHAAHLGGRMEQTRACLEQFNVRLDRLEGDLGIIKDYLVATMGENAAPQV